MVIDNELIGPRAARYLDYVDAIKVGELVTRQDMIDRMQSSYSAVMYNLERAVTEKALHKVYGFADTYQPCWLYALPETMPHLPGIDT